MTDKEKVVLDIISGRLDAQIESVDAFNTRAGLVLATCGMVFAGYMQLLTSKEWLTDCNIWLFVIEIGLLLISGGLAFASLAPGADKDPWLYNPVPRALHELHEKFGEDLDIGRVIESMLKAYDHNTEVFKEKYDLLRYSRWFLYGSAIIFTYHLFNFLF